MIIESALLCLALNVYHEARNQPVVGQYAVAHVTMNRAKHDPHNVCSEVFKPYQFSWANKLTTAPTKRARRALASRYMPKEQSAWLLAKTIARNTLEGKVKDVTNGSTHYHANYVNPYWAKSKRYVATLGDHLFYKKKVSKQ